jgi:hypothetical protein
MAATTRIVSMDFVELDSFQPSGAHPGGSTGHGFRVPGTFQRRRENLRQECALPGCAWVVCHQH